MVTELRQRQKLTRNGIHQPSASQVPLDSPHSDSLWSELRVFSARDVAQREEQSGVVEEAASDAVLLRARTAVLAQGTRHQVGVKHPRI